MYDKGIKVFIIFVFVLLFVILSLFFSMEPKTRKIDYTSCELGDLVGDDVERINYESYTLDYHSKDFEQSKVIKYANRCIDEGIKSQYEMDCCLTYKMYPEAYKRGE